ncbi:MAG: RNase adapter RapZ [Oscillospiraceae bacterium]|nr:RNase adapter RapZ [Oscillospiraceae bacterium]
MEFFIISGLSGAGKSKVAAILEDLDFYCVDNMPVVLMPIFAELCIATKGRYDKVALVTDVRGQDSFDELFSSLERMRALGVDYKIIYIEASNSIILKRYKETRRRHPLDPDGLDVTGAINREKKLLAPIRDRADYIINTSTYSLSNLQHKIQDIFADKKDLRGLNVNIQSFGFKYGLPADADLVFDVRFLPNPYYVPELTHQCGMDEPVREFIFQYEQTNEFMKKLQDLVGFLLPNYAEEGKPSVVIAIGCTGGHHRSVAVAEALAAFVRELGYETVCTHRDVSK